MAALDKRIYHITIDVEGDAEEFARLNRAMDKAERKGVSFPLAVAGKAFVYNLFTNYDVDINCTGWSYTGDESNVTDV